MRIQSTTNKPIENAQAFRAKKATIIRPTEIKIGDNFTLGVTVKVKQSFLTKLENAVFYRNDEAGASLNSEQRAISKQFKKEKRIETMHNLGEGIKNGLSGFFEAILGL